MDVDAQLKTLQERPNCPKCREPMSLFIQVSKRGTNPGYEAFRCSACNEAVTREIG